MIDISSETVITLIEATRHLPRRRRGKRPHVATVYRWAQTGIGGIRLETIQIGGSRCTSVEALQRFFDRLTDSEASALVSPRSAARRRSVAAAERRLDDAGI